MIMGAFIVWLVWWRRYVRPLSAQQHAEGARHMVVYGSGLPWRCLDCSYSENYRPPISAGGWIYTAFCVLLTLMLLSLGGIVTDHIVSIV